MYGVYIFEDKCWDLRGFMRNHQYQKDRLHSKKMNRNGLNLSSISPKQTDLQTDRISPFGHPTEKQEKAHPSLFLSLSQASQISHSFLPDKLATSSQNQNGHFFSNVIILTLIF
jgi:hypothetical protein